MEGLNGFRRDVLYIIAGNPGIKGTKIAELIEERYEHDIFNSRLYPALTDLAERGLIDKGARDDRTNEHTLTEAGEELLRDQREWENEITGFDW